MLLEKDMAQINHNSAANALRDLVHITNLGDRPYLVDIYMDKEEKPGIIKYTLKLESTTHKCIELRRIISSYQSEQFIQVCQSSITDMEDNLFKNEQHATPKY